MLSRGLAYQWLCLPAKQGAAPPQSTTFTDSAKAAPSWPQHMQCSEELCAGWLPALIDGLMHTATLRAHSAELERGVLVLSAYPGFEPRSLWPALIGASGAGLLFTDCSSGTPHALAGVPGPVAGGCTTLSSERRTVRRHVATRSACGARRRDGAPQRARGGAKLVSKSPHGADQYAADLLWLKHDLGCAGLPQVLGHDPGVRDWRQDVFHSGSHGDEEPAHDGVPHAF